MSLFLHLLFTFVNNCDILTWYKSLSEAEVDMTEKLFEADSHLLSFDSIVKDCLNTEDGYLVVLGATAFVPEQGGQYSDVGTLDNATVSDVQVREDVIYHKVDKPLEVGSLVHGEVDRVRRLRNLQNHTGEHIACGLIYQEYGFNNVGFHLGTDDITFDMDGVVTPEMLRHIEYEANRVVSENRAVYAYYPTDEELKTLEFRSKKDISGQIRVVVIEGLDACACCVPHVKRTGEIGMIKLLSCMRYKGGTRIHMKCGFDALEYFNFEHDSLDFISNLISLPFDRIAGGVEKLVRDLGEANKRIYELKKTVLNSKIDALTPTDKDILFIEDGLEMSELRMLVEGGEKLTQGVCAAFSADSETEGEYKFAVAVKGKDYAEFKSLIAERLHARGGGRPPFIQGSAACSESEIKDFFDI